jgi:hypothetical protein
MPWFNVKQMPALLQGIPRPVFKKSEEKEKGAEFVRTQGGAGCLVPSAEVSTRQAFQLSVLQYSKLLSLVGEVENRPAFEMCHQDARLRTILFRRIDGAWG